ncbi:hypothetical protein BGZ83_012126, partial [Gryganskiella cystojenkinii]
KVNWDYEDLTRAITHAIRSVNYRYAIEISYPINNHMVQRAMVKKVKDKSLQSEFEMTISTRDFYVANYWSIIDQVKYKS